MSAKQMILPVNRVFDSDGAPEAGATLNLYLSGTTTPAVFYSDPGLSVSLGSTLTANAAGRFTPMAYGDSTIAYRLITKDANGGVLDDVDPFYFGAQDGAIYTGNFVNVKTFGAKGDGVTDDTANIQAAINFANAIAGSLVSTGGCSIFFPAGTYLVSSAIHLYPNLTLRGDGRTSTVIHSTHTGSGTGETGARSGSTFYTQFTINSSSVANVRIQDMLIYNSNAGNLGACYYDQGGTYINVTNVEARGHKYGILFDQSELADVYMCNISAQLTAGVWLVNGPDLNASAAGGYTNRISVSHCQISQTTAYCIVDDGGDAHSFEHNNYNGGSNAIRFAAAQPASVFGGEYESQSGNIIEMFSTTLSGRSVGGSFIDVQGGSFLASSGKASINCNTAGGQVKVDGVPYFSGGAGTSPITGASNFSVLGLGQYANGTSAAIYNGTPQSLLDMGRLRTSSLGYSTGAGGTVTQLTDKTTAVTINTLCGQIVTASTAMAASSLVHFVVNNSQVKSTDTIVLNLHLGQSTNGSYRYWVDAIIDGVFSICIENRTGGTLSEALTFNYSIIKSVIS